MFQEPKNILVSRPKPASKRDLRKLLNGIGKTAHEGLAARGLKGS
jgi:hypothetical protein